jgi:proline iminopeptidase
VNVAVTVRGAELHCTVRGHGPPCLFLSGIGTRPYERQTPPPITDHLTLVHVDLRGSGRSTGDAADLTFDVLADDLEAVRAHVGADKIAVLGHSVLGLLALEHGRRRPETVSHVLAVGTPPDGDMAALQARGAAFFEADASDERKRLLRENLAALPAGTPPAQAVLAQTPMRFHDPRFDAAPLFAEAEVRPEFMMHVMGTLARGWNVAADARPLRVPTLIAHGRHDYVVPYGLWEGVARKLPAATFHLFQQSGHQPFVEEPAEFAAVVTAWMRGRC